jgi:hypothetical protein
MIYGDFMANKTENPFSPYSRALYEFTAFFAKLGKTIFRCPTRENNGVFTLPPLPLPGPPFQVYGNNTI